MTLTHTVVPNCVSLLTESDKTRLRNIKLTSLFNLLTPTHAQLYFIKKPFKKLLHVSVYDHLIYYKRYVDDILIIYDQNRTNEQTILHQINTTDKNLQRRIKQYNYVTDMLPHHRTWYTYNCV